MLLRDFLLPVALAWAATAALHRVLHPADVRDAVAAANGYGKVRLHVKLPGTHAGIPEPLLSCGRIGNASLVFIRLLPGGRARVGVEFWNLELDQGPEFALPAADAELDITCSLPALYPPEGDPAWGAIAPALQHQRRHEYLITVDGRAELRGVVDYLEPLHSPLYVGTNPLGGSFVSSRFTGRILTTDQRF